MSVGLVVPLPAYTLDPAFFARKAEELGFESLWYHEHPILPVHSASPFPATGGEIPWTYAHFTEPYIALAMAAAVPSESNFVPALPWSRSEIRSSWPSRYRYWTCTARGGLSSVSAPVGTGKRLP